LVFKRGEVVVRDGAVIAEPFGRTFTATPARERAIEKRMREYYNRRYGLSPDFLIVPEAAVGRPDAFEPVPCST
jgi:formylmethanofuran dehydrogenase subunit A